MEKLSEKRLLLWTATPERIEDVRNAVTVALRLIKPMGNMPVCKKIMFEKIQNKMTINHKVAVLPLVDWKKTTATNKKSKQSTPNLCFTACVVFSQFEVNNKFFERIFFEPVSSFCTFPSIQATYSIIPPSESHGLHPRPPVPPPPPLPSMFRTF